jgi:hypothetical protein
MSKVVQTLKLSTSKNMLKKEITNLQIMESMAATKKIRDDIMRKIRSKENRDTLGTSKDIQKSLSKTMSSNFKTSNLKSISRFKSG